MVTSFHPLPGPLELFPSRLGANPEYTPPEYTPEESRRLLVELLKLPPGRAWRFRLLVLVESIYGVRESQARLLEWSDVDFDARYPVTLPDGRELVLEGAHTFRQATTGSKGQPDRSLPLLPFVREAYLQARTIAGRTRTGCSGTGATRPSQRPTPQ